MRGQRRGDGPLLRDHLGHAGGTRSRGDGRQLRDVDTEQPAKRVTGAFPICLDVVLGERWDLRGEVIQRAYVVGLYPRLRPQVPVESRTLPYVWDELANPLLLQFHYPLSRCGLDFRL